MKPDTRKEREIALYEAALRLIARGVNPAAMKVQQIADEAGIGKGTVYEYFASKEEILHGMALHCFDTEIARFAALLEPCTTLQGLEEAVLAYLQDLSGSRMGTYQVIASSVGPQNTPEGMDLRLTALHGVLHKTIAALQQNGEIDPSLPDHYCDFALLSAAAGGLMSMCCPGKPEGPHYLAHQAVDSDFGIIVGQTVTAGDVNDSVPFLGLIEHIHENVVPIQTATADAAYDFPLAHRALGELGIDFFVRPQKTAARANTQFTRDDFRYDEGRDIYLCPREKELRLRRLARSASGLFWEYQADKRDCALCSLRGKCLRESDKRGARKVSVSYFAADRQRSLERRSSPEYREALKLRQVWCEGSFSAQKREHNLARVLRRGLEAAEDHCLLSATALNLKRMIKYAG